MPSIEQMPEWFGTAVLGAVIAAIGYVAKLLLEWISEILANGRTRRAQLARLLSLLRASKAAFEVQCENRDRLKEMISMRDHELAASTTGYEQLFSQAFPGMTEEERELHTIIRAITTNTLMPLNKEVLSWLKDDTYFKAKTWGSGIQASVAGKLSGLEAHLYLWVAKYEVWIPENKKHALVYLADEKKHGVGFPTGIEKVVGDLLNKRWWFVS